MALSITSPTQPFFAEQVRNLSRLRGTFEADGTFNPLLQTLQSLEIAAENIHNSFDWQSDPHKGYKVVDKLRENIYNFDNYLATVEEVEKNGETLIDSLPRSEYQPVLKKVSPSHLAVANQGELVDIRFHGNFAESGAPTIQLDSERVSAATRRISYAPVQLEANCLTFKIPFPFEPDSDKFLSFKVLLNIPYGAPSNQKNAVFGVWMRVFPSKPAHVAAHYVSCQEGVPLHRMRPPFYIQGNQMVRLTPTPGRFINPASVVIYNIRPMGDTCSRPYPRLVALDLGQVAFMTPDNFSQQALGFHLEFDEVPNEPMLKSIIRSPKWGESIYAAPKLDGMRLYKITYHGKDGSSAEFLPGDGNRHPILQMTKHYHDEIEMVIKRPESIRFSTIK